MLTAAAIAGGAGFLAGTTIYADTASAAFYDQLARGGRNVDVVVLPPDNERVPAESLQAMRSLPEMSDVDGRFAEVLGLLDTRGKLISNEGLAGSVISLPAVAALSRFDVVEGRMPQAQGELAVDRATAQRYGFAVGDPAQVVTEEGPHPFQVVGLIDLGVSRGISGLSTVAMSDVDLRALVQPKGFAEVVARSTGDPEAARQAVATLAAAGAFPPGTEVLTGDEWRRRIAIDASKYVDGFHQVLQGFALIALAVCGFVIYNTFSILTARRTRELALWRCLGAGRTRLRALVFAEAAALGVIGALAGIAVGVATGWALIAGRAAFGGTAVPDHSLVVRPDAILTTLLVGTVTALIASAPAAWRAGHIAPLAALREATLHDLRPRPWPRVAAAVVLGAAGAWMMRRGLPWGFDGLVWIFGGASVLFGGLILAAPLVVGRVTAVVGWLPARLLGAPGRLALGHARHSPRRAAATTSAVMVGMGVLATVSVLLATAADQSRKELSENFSVDFKLTSVDVKMGNGKSRVPRGLIEKLRAHKEFAAATGLRNDLSIVDNSGIYAWTAQSLAAPFTPEVIRGDLTALGDGNVAVDRFYADDLGIELGARLRVEERDYTVIAVFDDAPSGADILFGWADYARIHGESEPDEVIVALAPGVTVTQGQGVLDEVLAGYPLIEVSGNAQQRAELTGAFDRLLGIFTALLGVALLIALFGIGNTLALSVWERGRESATLRALGLSRRGLLTALLLEAALMALVGGGAGLLFGGAVGWAAATGLISFYGHGMPTVPFGQFAIYLAIAALAAGIAALLPARTATKTPIVAGLGTSE